MSVARRQKTEKSGQRINLNDFDVLNGFKALNDLNDFNDLNNRPRTTDILFVHSVVE